MSEQKRWVVTGGAGFIGKHLVEHLLEQGHAVKVVDNFSHARMSEADLRVQAIDFLKADVRNTPQMIEAMVDADYVVHLAAISDATACAKDAYQADQVNRQGTCSVMAAAVENGVRRVVLASSAAVYGDDTHARQKEGREGACRTRYALSKQAAEEAAENFSRLGLEVVPLRFFNVYGPGGRGVVDRMARDRAAGRVIEIDGDGKQVRDFIHVDDVVRAIIAAALKPQAASVGPINVGTGHGTSINQLFNGTGGGQWFTDRQDGGVRSSVADVGKMTEVLGVRAKALKLGLEPA
jgi:UDP-glucose 4-epimerase